jgi:hypothetical protein
MSGDIWDNVDKSIERSLARTATRAGNNMVTGAAGSVLDGATTRTQMAVDGMVSGLFGVESRTSMRNSGYGRGGIHTTGVDGESAYKGAVSGRWQTPGEEQVYPGAVPGGLPRASGYSYTPASTSRQQAAQANAAMQQQVELYKLIGARVIEAQQYAPGTPERQTALDRALAIADKLPRDADGKIAEPISRGESLIITSGHNGKSLRYQINRSDNFASSEELVASMGRVAEAQMKPAYPVGREDFGLDPLPEKAVGPVQGPGGSLPVPHVKGSDQKLVDGIVASIAEVQLAKKSDPAVINAVASQVAAAAEKDAKLYDGVKLHKIGPVTVKGKGGIDVEIEGGIYTPARITQLVMAAMGAEPEVLAAVNKRMGAAAPAVPAPAPTVLKTDAPASPAPAPGTPAPAATAAAPAPSAGNKTVNITPPDDTAAKLYAGADGKRVDPSHAPKIAANQVKEIQVLLGAKDDGKWGPETQSKFAAYCAKATPPIDPHKVDFTKRDSAEMVALMNVIKPDLVVTAAAAPAAPAAGAVAGIDSSTARGVVAGTGTLPGAAPSPEQQPEEHVARGAQSRSMSGPVVDQVQVAAVVHTPQAIEALVARNAAARDVQPQPEPQPEPVAVATAAAVAPLVLASPAAAQLSAQQDKAAILEVFGALQFQQQPAPAAASMPAPEMQAALQKYNADALDLTPRVPNVLTPAQKEARMGHAVG